MDSKGKNSNMQIRAVEIHHLSMPLVKPFKTSMHVEHNRECLLIRVEGEGGEGWGECVTQRVPWFSYESIGTAWHVLEDFIIPGILGEELESAKQFPEKVRTISGHPMAKAGVEMALWDLEGKISGESLAEMLGADRAKVEVGISIGIQESPDALLDLLSKHLAEGYSRVKLKIKPGQDLEVVRAAREAHPDLRLQVDANAAYNLESSDVFLEMDSLGLLLIEQPFSTDDIQSHAALQSRLSTPICLDESIDSAMAARLILDLDACRIVNIKAGRVGGLSQAIEIHDLCLGRDVPVWCGGMLETGIGRASNLALAALPGFSLPGDISATDRYYEVDIASPRFELNPDSTIDVPRGDGLGVEVDRSAVEKFGLRSKLFTL